MTIKARALSGMGRVRDGVALVDPVGGEVGGEGQNLHVLEAYFVEGSKGGADVGAMSPGAATAVEHDGLAMGPPTRAFRLSSPCGFPAGP